ncbi:hypothetical protein [Streptomyces paradoxus]|uniref:Uncharacterized protein n=1 Tax=Streptomyces paradoxus TaxID=66375 RepID=A0A7W9WIR1_9ACTN|nr:hypothetical protein [Streptomyces paradoxus]MBB6080242.1 hypothetical protein [Streptomyces paradoxus]
MHQELLQAEAPAVRYGGAGRVAIPVLLTAVTWSYASRHRAGRRLLGDGDAEHGAVG